MTRPIVIGICCLFLVAGAVFAQSDRGTITGTIADPVGGIIPGAKVEAKNDQTGALFQAESTATGVYTLAQLPTGVYQLSVSVPGFKQYLRTGITVLVAQTLRIDITLEVGELAETVTVNADAPLLKTESGDLSHNVDRDRLEDLPILSVSGGIRSPYAVTQLLPGATQVGRMGGVRVNGTPANTQSVRVDGQDSTNNIWTNAVNMGAAGVDSIEEFAIQTSNFAAEYGQVGGGLFNLTMKSGTNAFHGSAYEYMRNEAFNAQQPFINIKPRERRHDFGFTAGGPIYIPKVVDGRDKSFFFVSFEENRIKQVINTTYYTVPILAFQQGDFSSILTGRNLCPSDNPNCALDTQGNAVPIMEGTIYDPETEQLVNDQRVRDPFPNNIIPEDRWDPVAKKYNSFMPKNFANSNPTSNYAPVFDRSTVQSITSIKLDHMFSPRLKLSVFESVNNRYSPGADGFEAPITANRSMSQWTSTSRLNIDYTIRPTMMFHFGAGLWYFLFEDDPSVTDYDTYKELGLPGTTSGRLPAFFGLGTPQGGLFLRGGGFTSSGPNANQQQYGIKPTSNVSLIWAKNNHTYKFGAEMVLEGFPGTVYTPANGFFTFDAAETGLPYLNTNSPGGGYIGFPYASFLLGLVDSGETAVVSTFRHGKQSWALYAQDTWKVTRKLTLDYGLRWDYQTYLKEQYGRQPSLGTTTPNPRAGNLPGGIIFEATGPDFAKVYPYAFGPRLGVAYQITPKTVLRGGWGLSYGKTASLELWSLRFGSDVRFGPSSSFGEPITTLSQGPPVQAVWPDFDPGQAPVNVGAPFITMVDHNAGRPPRMNMWSIGIQREITTNFAVEATYVGNRGVWWISPALNDINRLTPAILAKNNLDISKQEDRDVLNSTLDSPLAISRGFKPPYAGYPLGTTVSQSLRPYPMFGGINVMWSPLGNSWYDSLQIKATKRYSYGLDLSGSLTWQKELNIGAETQDPALAAVAPSVNDLTNLRSNKYISGLSQPFRLVIAGSYTFPKLNVNKFLSYAIRNWQFSTVLQYQSGFPIHVPLAQNQIATLLQLCSNVSPYGGCNGNMTPGSSAASHANRVPGEPLFTQDLNSNFDPNKEFVLNPNAWSDPEPGQFGVSPAYYNDYRYSRRPSEAMSLGRIFQFGEGKNLQIRIELNNVFNRTYMSDPVSNNALQSQIRNKAGQPTSGFGYINTRAVASSPRNGQLVVRFNF